MPAPPPPCAFTTWQCRSKVLDTVNSVSLTCARAGETVEKGDKGQFNLGELRNKDNKTPAVWNAVLAA